MRVLGFLLLTALVRAQINIDTVCRYVVNTLDCRRFDYKPLCATGGQQYSTECEFTKAHCLDSNLKVLNEGPCVSTVVPDTTVAAVTTSVPDSTAPPVVDTTADSTPDVGSTAGPATSGLPDTTVTSGPVTVTIPPDVTTAPMTSEDTMMPTDADTTMMMTTMMMTTGTTPTPTTTTDPNLSDVCNQIVNTPCQDDNSPLCATNGNTYPNYCEYSKARCYYPDMHLAYTGPCSATDTFASLSTIPRSTPPPSVFDIICRTLQQVTCDKNDGVQVCGSNGVTYDTACDFEKAKCEDSSLTVTGC